MKIRESIDKLRNNLRLCLGAPQNASQRGAGRDRRAAITSGTAVIARAVQVGTSLVTIPLTIHYLGNERFGVWMTISSVLAMANFADFGIGNGVLNTVARAFGKDDFDDVRRTISSGFVVLAIIALVLLGVFVLMFAFVSWADVFRITSARARAEAAPALIVFATCFVLNIPLDVVQRAQLGIQEGFRTNLWQIFGSAMGLIGVVVGIRMQAGLPLLIAAFAGAPVLAAALNSAHFFLISRTDLIPRWRFVSRRAISQIATLGGQFFLLQLVVAVAFSADNVIIARTLGAASVPDYSVPQRMYSLISLMVAMLVAPLWPAYAEAVSCGDIAWVRRTLRRSLIAVFVAAVIASATLLVFAHSLIFWWVGTQIHAPFLLLLGLAIWTVMDCCGNTLAMFLNGAGIMRFQLIIAPTFGLACLMLKILLTRRYGIPAVPWATILTYAAIVVVAYAIYVPRVLQSLHAVPNRVSIATAVHSVAEE